MTTKAHTTKAKIDKWNYVELKNIYALKEIIRVKRQPMQWEKIFVNHKADKELISRIYKELLKNSNHQLQCAIVISNTTKQSPGTSWVSYNKTQFWHYLPGERIRFHR